MQNETLKTASAAQSGHAVTMARVKASMDRLGDLPIFSTSINKVRRVSSDPQSNAMAVAQEVLKDANLCAKLLRLGNSAYYNRGLGKISVVSRAVILLGFETVKNLTLTLKLIESFQNKNTAIDMTQMLVRAYLAAGLVREVAAKCGVKDIEESYVCALLHNLGEIIVAYVLPDDFLSILDKIKQQNMSQSQAEFAVLGTSFDAIGQELATNWEFSPLVVSSMARTAPKITGPLRDRMQLNRALARLGNNLVGALYVDRNQDAEYFADSMQHLAIATGLDLSRIENSLTESFHMSCALAQEYGLDRRHLQPNLGNGDENIRNKWARQFSYYASVDGAAAVEPVHAPAPPANGTATAQRSAVAPVAAAVPVPVLKAAAVTAEAVPVAPVRADNSQRQLVLIQEITQLIAGGARLNQVFVKVLEGIWAGADFDRVLLCLVTPDRRSYVARLAAGSGHENLKAFFNLPIAPRGDVFSKLLVENGELLVTDTHDSAWAQKLPRDFAAVANTTAWVAAALQFDGKPVGLFYADRAITQRPLTSDDLRNVVSFVTQARLALRLCS